MRQRWPSLRLWTRPSQQWLRHQPWIPVLILIFVTCKVCMRSDGTVSFPVSSSFPSLFLLDLSSCPFLFVPLFFTLCFFLLLLLLSIHLLAVLDLNFCFIEHLVEQYLSCVVTVRFIDDKIKVKKGEREKESKSLGKETSLFGKESKRLLFLFLIDWTCSLLSLSLVLSLFLCHTKESESLMKEAHEIPCDLTWLEIFERN